jgi:hypothetical protein
MTTTTTTQARPVLPARQARWTHLGAGMGYTNTEAKRAAIRNAVESMVWVDPAQLTDLLESAPVRYYVGGLFYLRRWALAAAAVVPFPDAACPARPLDGQQRLIGLQSVTEERYVLLDLGYEAIDLLHDTPTVEEMAR